MKSAARALLLRFFGAMYQVINRHIIFRMPAQDAHEAALRWLRRLERIPFSPQLASLLRRLTFEENAIEVGGVRLPQRLILAAGLLKGDGFADEEEALRAVLEEGRNIMPGWRILPTLVGPAEFGSFTRYPRLGNDGTVVWRHAESLSTQNRVGLRNPGARAAARFLGERIHALPKAYRHQYRGLARCIRHRSAGAGSVGGAWGFSSMPRCYHPGSP